MLEDKDILQVNATIIAGILILLTLTNIAGVAIAARRLAAYTVIAIIPLAISMTKIIDSYRFNATDKKPIPRLSLALTQFGLFALIVVVTVSFLASYFAPDLLK